VRGHCSERRTEKRKIEAERTCRFPGGIDHDSLRKAGEKSVREEILLKRWSGIKNALV